ncbi:MAG: hypothetical protein K2Q24_07440 [Chitinophagaceae bacterium]|jgi:hypothetical protein|nr:hypothetical protein [Chitinophagaceae bacterium]
MKKNSFVLVGMIACLFLSSYVTEQQGWRFIGDKWAAFGPDRDVLRVGRNDLYRQVKLKVTDGPLRIEDVDIYFENGEKMNVILKNNFRAGQESRVIDLPGAARKLDRIEFLYSTIGKAKGRARIAVWGKR